MGPAERLAILISGFYGFGNVGDEAVLAATVQSLRARLGSVPLVVLSADPAATAAAYGVEAVSRTSLPAILAALRRSRLFLSGGGSLIQDATSARSALYYLGLLRLAQIRRVRTMVYAAGLGPLRRPLIRRLAGSVLGRTDVVAVRDRDSAALLPAIGVRRPPVLAADPAALLRPGNAPPSGGPVIGVVIRPWGDDAYVTPLAAALVQVATRRSAPILVVPFHRALDLAVSRQLAEASGGRLIDRDLAPADALALIGGVQVVVGMRMHALLFAAMAGVPPVGLAYDPKVTALFGDLEVGDPLPLGADTTTMATAIEQAWEHREALRPTLLAASARLRTRAEVAVEEAVRLYSAV